MKKLVSLLIVVLVMAVSTVSAFAAPSTLSSGTKGTSTSLITIKKPETSVSSTTKKSYAISAVGNAGTQVGVYKWNGANYYSVGSATIGSSRIFVKQLALTEGTNRLAVWAGRNGATQVVHLQITVLKQSVVNGINNYKVNYQKGW